MLAAVIPAAGASSRMRFPKGALLVRGGSLLSSQCDTVFRAVDRTVVVLGWGAGLVAKDLSPDVERIVAPCWWCGTQGDSVRLALQALPGCSRLLVQPVDVPPVSPRVLEVLLRSEHSAVPLYRGRPGHPVLLAEPELARLRVAVPPLGLRGLLEAARRIPVDDPAVCMNLNHPRQFVRWLRGSSPASREGVMRTPRPDRVDPSRARV
jgi:molybdenum cofactor cytidylyltransferase